MKLAVWTPSGAQRRTTCITRVGLGPDGRRLSPRIWWRRISGVLARHWPYRGRGRSSRIETPRSQFYHVNDIVPTIYDVLDITPPKMVDGGHAGSVGWRQHGSFVQPPEGAREQAKPVLRDHGQLRLLQERLVRRGLWSAYSLEARRGTQRRKGWPASRILPTIAAARTGRLHLDAPSRAKLWLCVLLFSRRQSVIRAEIAAVA